MSRNTVGYSSVKEMYVPDEQELRKLESMVNAGVLPEMLTTEICSRSTLPILIQLLSKSEKSIVDYETLVIKDAQLEFNTID